MWGLDCTVGPHTYMLTSPSTRGTKSTTAFARESKRRTVTRQAYRGRRGRRGALPVHGGADGARLRPGAVDDEGDDVVASARQRNHYSSTGRDAGDLSTIC